MLLCTITSRVLLADTEEERTEKLIALASDWAAGGVDFIQVRERDLAQHQLLDLASSVVQAVRCGEGLTRVLINGEPERALAIAIASGADGVHLRGGFDAEALAARIVSMRHGWRGTCASRQDLWVSVSCHSVAEVKAARAAAASLALFAPVFEKALPGAPALSGHGLEALAEACRVAREPAPYPELPVLALGGVSLENAPACLAAGADGIAAIRMFLDADWQVLRQH